MNCRIYPGTWRGAQRPRFALLLGQPKGCGSSKLNAAESLMQEAPPWKAALCMACSSTAVRVPRSERERLDCQDPGVNLPPILTAKEVGSELEIVRPRLCSGDADHPVAARRERGGC